MTNTGIEEVQVPERRTETAQTSDRLDRLLSDSEAQPVAAATAVAEGGGVPPERQPVEAPAGSEGSDTPTPEGETLDLPADVLPAPTQKPKAAPPAPPIEEPMPEEVRRGSKKGQDAWAAAKRSEKQAKAEAEQLRKELETLRKAQPPAEPTPTEDVTKLKQQLEAAEHRLGQLDLASSRVFKAQYDDKINDGFRKGVGMLVQAGHDAKEARERVRALLHPEATDEAVREQLGDLPGILQGQLYTVAAEARAVQMGRTQALREWKTQSAAVREEELRQSQAAHQQALVNSMEGVADTLRGEGSFLFARSATDDKWNSQVDARVAAAKGILSGPPETLAKYVAEGVAAGAYRTLYLKERAKAAKLQADLDTLASGRPIVGRDGGVDGAPKPPVAPKATNHESWLEQHLS